MLSDAQVFVEVVRCGSFSAAAAALGTTVATVSRRLKALEDHLGAVLIDRGPRHFAITDAGRVFHPAALRVCEAMDAGESAVHALRDEPRGVVSVAAPTPMLHGFLGRVFAEFADANPRVQLQVFGTDGQFDPHDRGIDLSISARLHLLDLAHPPSRPTNTLDRTLGRLAMRIVASPAYLATHGEPRDLDDLEARPCVILGASPQADSFEVTHASGQRRRVAVPTRLFTTDTSVAVRAAVAGLGPAGLPAIDCRAHVDAGRLVVLLPEWQLVPIRVAARFAAGPMRPALRDLLDRVAARIASEAPWC